jgi:SAM-dependent methyltransferase
MKRLSTVIIIAALAGCRGGGPAHEEGVQARPDHFEKRFDDPEAWAKKFDDPSRDAWQKPEAVVALLKLEQGGTVADIGAGTGYFLSHLSKAVGAGGRVIALDIEEGMVKYLGRRADREGLKNVETRVIPPDDPLLPAGKVDRILIVNTWHHIPARGIYAAKLAQALAPGGAVFIVDYTLESHDGPPKEHRLPPEKVIAELREGGLEGEVVQEDLPRQYVVAGRLPRA